MVKSFTQADLARALGISGAMVSKLAKRGMPTDSAEAATAWRTANLSPFMRKGRRIDGNTGLRRGRQPVVLADRKLPLPELLELINDLIDLAMGDPAMFDDGCRHVATVFLELPAEVQDTIRMPFGIWQRLCGNDEAEA